MKPNILCKHYMDIVYAEVQKIFSGAKNTVQAVTQAQGEILYQGVGKLLTKIDLTEADVFFDLGSGVGKIVLQVFLQTQVKAAIGIELAPELHKKSLAAAQRIGQDLPALFSVNRKLNFVLGDFLTTSFAEATVLLLNSTCYSQEMLLRLGEIINDCPHIRYVLTLRTILNLEKLTLSKIVRVQCSWDTALCFIYSSKTGQVDSVDQVLGCLGKKINTDRFLRRLRKN
jgi:hypothetical protein